MNLQQLLFVVETAKAGSISKAAKNLYVSQPNLSKAIQNLEEELRVSLFFRTGKGVSLTSDGEEFLQYARSVLHQCDDIKKRYGQGGKDVPSLRISTSRVSFVTETLVEIFEEGLFAEQETFSLSIREVCPQEAYDDIVEGASNMAIVFMGSRTTPYWTRFLNDQQLEVIPLFRSTPRLVLRKNHPLLSLPTITMDDLKKYPLIQKLGSSVRDLDHREEIHHLRFKEFPKIVYAGDRSVICSFLKNTDAIFFSMSTLKIERVASYVVDIPLPDEIPTISGEFCLLKRENTKLSPLEEKLVARLRAFQRENILREQ